jgi:hypothetical protein
MDGSAIGPPATEQYSFLPSLAAKYDPAKWRVRFSGTYIAKTHLVTKKYVIFNRFPNSAMGLNETNPQITEWIAPTITS